MRLILSSILLCICLCVSAQKPDVTYLERTGNNGSIRVFSVTTPVEETKVETVDGKFKLQPKEVACREVMKAILFDGVENFNQGMPLVTNANDSFANSLINPKTKTFMSYFKVVELENTGKNKQAYHYILELNHYNLMRLLKMRGSCRADYQE